MNVMNIFVWTKKKQQKSHISIILFESSHLEKKTYYL